MTTLTIDDAIFTTLRADPSVNPAALLRAICYLAQFLPEARTCPPVSERPSSTSLLIANNDNLKKGRARMIRKPSANRVEGNLTA